MKYYCYILFSQSTDKFYIGHTKNIDQRMKKHRTNHNGYTAKYKDWKIIYKEGFSSKKDAYKRERIIKNWKSKTKIKNLIQNTN